LLLIILLAAAGWWWIGRAHRGDRPNGLAGVLPADPTSTAVHQSATASAPPLPAAQPAFSPPATDSDQPDTAALQAIAALLQDQKLVEAEAQLHRLPVERLQVDALREAAALWNNLGAMKQKQSGPAAGVSAYQRALALDPEHRAATLNLTLAYWQSKDPALTRDMLERAAALAPGEPWPHLALADRLHEKDDLSGAKQHLDQALQAASPTSEYQPYVKALAAKLERAEQAERAYVSRESSHFVVKFNGNEDYDVWTRVLGILEDAYREIGQRFSYFPSRPIIVVLHTKVSFQSATGSPAWADGLFDPMLGRIQVPTQGALTDQAWLTRVLRHEYVHALLHQRMDGRLGAVPTWLNEGLAMQLAGDPWPDIDQIARGPVTIIPLNHLEGGWGALPHQAAVVAYLESNSATRYLVDRFGMGKVQEVLSDLARRQSIEAALQGQISTTYEEFQRQWVNELNARVQTGRS
jgi:Tfp pilus assembly protein PilF